MRFIPSPIQIAVSSIALLAGLNCLCLSNRDDLSPAQEQLLQASTQIFYTASTAVVGLVSVRRISGRRGGPGDHNP